jgi:hypothetical protein
MPFICLRRSDIPAGTLQVLDLWPNTSQRNPSIDPVGQTKYIQRYQNDTLAALSANATVAEYRGIAAYLIDHVEDNVTNVTITVTVANAAAVAIAALVDAGSAVTLAVVNAALVTAGAGAGTQLNANGSDGVLANLLRVLAGAEYVLPRGRVVGGVAGGASLGSFTAGQYRATYEGSALFSSIAEGQIAGFSSATFSYDDVVGPALVVYADDGSVLI